MRRYRFVAAITGFLLAGSAFAQTYPADAVILSPEVEVRSGPSKNFYATSKLRQNERVTVLRESKEAPGWLEIKPPPLSFSWISAKSVKQIDATHGFVDCDPARPVQILPGSRVVDQPPNRESMKLTAGTVVVIVDRPLSIQGETWLPIQPHPSEVRYIPAEAVKAATVVAATQNGPASWIPGGKGPTPGTPTSNPRPDETRTAFSPAGPTTGLQKLKEAGWSAYGRLYETKLAGDAGQPLYALDIGGGQTVYVSTIPGKSLQSYIGRTVSVYGPTMYRAELAARLPFIVASHVAVP